MTTIHTNYTNSAYTKAVQYEKPAAEGFAVMPATPENMEIAATYEPSGEVPNRPLNFGRMELKPAPGYSSIQEMIAEFNAKNPNAGKLPDPKVPENRMSYAWLDNTNENQVKPEAEISYVLDDRYYKDAFEYFRQLGDEGEYWDDYARFSTSLREVQEEAGALIAQGKEVDINALTTRIDMHGVEMTLGELQTVQDIINSVKQTENDYFAFSGVNGVQGMEWTTFRGLSVLAVRQRLNESGLSQEVVDMAAQAHQLHLEHTMYTNAQYDGDLKAPPAHIKVEGYYTLPSGEKVWGIPSYEKELRPIFDPKDMISFEEWRSYSSETAKTPRENTYYAQPYYSLDGTASFNMDAYEKVLNFDISSEESLNKSFDEFYTWYKGHMQTWNDLYGGYYKPGQLSSAESRTAFIRDMQRIFFG